MTTTSKYAWQGPSVTLVEPPRLPEDFILLTDAQPLLSLRDERWVARIFERESGTEGVLLYEENREVAHLTADEVVGMLAYIIREAGALLRVCDPTISALHAQTIETLRLLWRTQETQKARTLLAESDTLQGQEGQGA